MISLLICDDHAVVRYGIMAVREAHGGFELVAAGGSGAEAIAAAERFQPQVVLMDLLMPDSNGVAVTRELLKRSPQSKVMLLTSHEGDEYLVEAMQAGATSYLLKDTAPGELVQAIERTARGEPALHPRIARAMIGALSGGNSPSEALTSREQEILDLIAAGLKNSAIASQLGLSEKTVKNHITSLLDKLQLEDRTQAAIHVWRGRVKGGS
ncbi:response regulator [Chitinimonas sp.]|uniref:response regulator n=1 Tax=Chitinimonas sp. TaxID=1934313 RepID=UPI0035ADDAB2